MGETIGHFGEKRLLQEVILPMVNPNGSDHLPGDDCGIVSVPAGNIICASTDRVPWDLTAYRLKVMSEFDLGHYLATLNISDIAAMGAKPAGLLLNIALPSHFLVNHLIQIVKGALAAATTYDCPILGGDLSDSSEPSICATSIGYTKIGECLFRRGALPGDCIFMTRPFGLSATAFRYFREAKPRGMTLASGAEDTLRTALIQPIPQISTGQALARYKGRVTAMDNTDGLSQSLAELAAINKMHYQIDADLLTINELTIQVAEFLDEEPFNLGMGPGADMNLVGTIDDSTVVPDQEIIRIGTVREGTGVSITAAGTSYPLEPNGWNYFVEREES